MEKKQQTALKPYSYHTFLFPFILEGKDGTPLDQEQITAYIGEPWKEVDYKEKSSMKILGESAFYNFYRTQMYFHEPVNNAVLGNKVVKNYVYDPVKIHNKAFYCIDKQENSKQLHYELGINNIWLKIYNTGVGVLIFECENTRQDQRNLTAVKNINQYGRRITSPFLPLEDNGRQLCADRIGLEWNNGSGVQVQWHEMRFWEVFLYRKEIRYEEQKNLYNCIAGFVLDLLQEGFRDEIQLVTNQTRADKRHWFIYPALDDRMYVACIIKNRDFLEKVKKQKIVEGKNGEFHFRQSSDEKADEQHRTLKSLYELVYIDEEGEASCPTKRMMIELMNKQVYDRWLEDGTCYACSHHSFICLTREDENLELPVIIPFLELYVQMAILCLAQRSSIILFQKRAALFTEKMAGQGYDLNRRNTMKLLNLQESYIAFQNQLQFFEVTAEEQGIELYDMLCESLYIEKEKKMLEDQINMAYQATTINQGIKFNQGALVISLLAIFISTIGSIVDMKDLDFVLDGKKCPGTVVYLGIVIVACLAALGGYYFGLRKKNKK